MWYIIFLHIISLEMSLYFSRMESVCCKFSMCQDRVDLVGNWGLWSQSNFRSNISHVQWKCHICNRQTWLRTKAQACRDGDTLNIFGGYSNLPFSFYFFFKYCKAAIQSWLYFCSLEGEDILRRVLLAWSQIQENATNKN